MHFPFYLELFGFPFASLMAFHPSVLSLDDIYFGKCFLVHPPTQEDTGEVPQL